MIWEVHWFKTFISLSTIRCCPSIDEHLYYFFVVWKKNMRQGSNAVVLFAFSFLLKFLQMFFWRLCLLAGCFVCWPIKILSFLTNETTHTRWHQFWNNGSWIVKIWPRSFAEKKNWSKNYNFDPECQTQSSWN
jgi:hypothetical protein